MDTAAAPPKRFDPVAYLKLFRFPLVFTAIADSAAGYVLFEKHGGQLWVLVLLAVASAGLYLFGMAMNDIADLEGDRQIAPTKVLPAGRIPLKSARYAAWIALAVSFEAVVWLGMTGYFYQVIVPWLLAVLCILCYDLHWVKGPPVMGLVRASNFLLGVTVAIGVEQFSFQPKIWECLLFASPLFIYVTALTYVSTLEDQEIERTKLVIGSAIMILGALWASSLFPLSEGYKYASFSYGSDTVVERFNRYFSIEGTAISGVLAGWIIFRCRKARDRKGIMLLVRDGVAGIILLDAALVTSRTHDLSLGVEIAALLIPAAVSVAIFKRLA